ncbi:MAG: hypothetical protein V4772_08515 [Pseudomonadota bacterium]
MKLAQTTITVSPNFVNGFMLANGNLLQSDLAFSQAMHMLPFGVWVVIALPSVL